MNFLNRKSFFLAALFVVNSLCFAQTGEEKPSSKSSLSVAIEPFYFISRITKLDLEYKPKKHWFSYIISPEFFSGTVYDGSIFPIQGAPSDELRGFGIGLHQKISAKVNSNAVPYLAYGVTLRKNTITYDDEGFVPFQENGLSFYEYRNFTDGMKIKTSLFSVLVGVQITGDSKFQFDMYTGAGYKSSTKRSLIEGKRDYNQTFTDYAYNGFIFQLGVRIGYKIL